MLQKQQDEKHNLIIFGIGSALLMANLALLLRRAYANFATHWRSSNTVRSSITSLWTFVRADKVGPMNGKQAEEVDLLLHERRVEMARHMYHAATWCFVPIEAFVLGTILMGTPRYFSQSLDVYTHITFSLLTAIKACPAILHVKSMDLWYSLFSLCTVLAVTPLSVEKESIPALSNALVALRMLCAVASCNPPLVAFWSLVYWVSAATSFHVGDCNAATLPPTFIFVCSEGVAFANMVLLLYVWKNLLIAQARQEVEAKNAQSETSAVFAILSTMGDAVIQLDRNLNIVGESPQLATMLFQESHRSYAGMPFAQLLATEDDVKLFQEYMTKEVAPDQTLADVFHVKIRDVLNNTVRVEVFHVCKAGEGPHGDLHLLGIREETEFEQEDGLKATRLSPAKRSSTTCEGTPTAAPDSEVTVTVDAASLEVLQFSTAFVELCGQRPMKDTFNEWIAPNNRDEFRKHFRGKVNKWIFTDAPNARLCYKNMNLKIPLHGQSSFRCQTTCTMVLSHEDCPNEPGQTRAVAEAILTDIILKEKRDRKSRRSSRASSGGSDETGTDSGSSSDNSNSWGGAKVAEEGTIGRKVRTEQL